MSKDNIFCKNQTLRCGSRLLNISEPVVMGILNVTPDSFYDGGRYFDEQSITQRIEQLINEGADIIDIGAYSSRPGADHISQNEEIERLKKALDIIRHLYTDVFISIDTFRTEVARYCIETYDANIINDISGGELDPAMYDLIAEKNIPYIIMHMQGTPQNMQQNPVYENTIKELVDYFAEKTAQLNSKGITDLIIDPGFGFGKTLDHNYQILAGLEAFQILEQPLLVGLSRKSMIYKHLEISPEEAMSGTMALQMTALEKGADILRCHDVKEAKQIIQLYLKLKQANQENLDNFKSNNN